MGKTILNLAYQALLAEKARWLLWLPVGLAAGALAYFSLPSEPSSFALLPLLGLPVLLRYGLRRHRFWWVLILSSACAIALGGLLAKLATDRNHITMLDREVRMALVRGQVIEIGDEAGGKLKLTIAVESIDGLKPEETPQRVRVSYRGKDAAELLTGESVELRAGLLPPTGPVMPGAFDFARYFYFKGIGGVGYALPPIKKLQQSEQTDSSLWMAQLRQELSQRIRSQLPPTEGAIAAALMMGDRAGIPAAVNQQMRDANLSHILSISGLHMAIFTGLVFLAARYGLLLLPFTRHRLAGKKVAAVAALSVGGLYLLVSGMPPSAVRAYVMVAFLFGAVLLEREVMPMRSLALAAVLMLLWWPAYVLDPGFQLSFMATAALIAWYEWISVRVRRYEGGVHWLQRLMLYAGGILATSLVAEVATAPLVLYHFNSISFYGMVANLLVSPVVTFLIMPCIIVAYALMPLQLEALPLQLVGYGVHFMVQVAQLVSEVPNAQTYARAMPGWGCAFAMLGLCWLMVWQRRVRWLGAVAMVLGIASIATTHSPDIYVSSDGRQIAARLDGKLLLLKGRAQSFVPLQWANVNGQEVLPYVSKQSPAWRCDAQGCVLRQGDLVAAVSDSPASLPMDCARAQLVVAPSYYVRRRECDAMHLLDRWALTKGGTHWFWLEKGKLVSGNTAQEVGRRPWRHH